MAERCAAAHREITRTCRTVLELPCSRFGKITHRSSGIATGMKAITFLGSRLQCPAFDTSAAAAAPSSTSSDGLNFNHEIWMREARHAQEDTPGAAARRKQSVGDDGPMLHDRVDVGGIVVDAY